MAGCTNAVTVAVRFKRVVTAAVVIIVIIIVVVQYFRLGGLVLAVFEVFFERWLRYFGVGVAVTLDCALVVSLAL